MFVRGKIDQGDQAGSYFLEKGIRVKIKDLKAFAATLEEIFVNTDFVGRLIGGLSNFDIRRSLHLSHRIICSAIISIDNLVSTYIIGSRARIRRAEVYLALIKGDYSFFNQSESDLLLNVFSVRPDSLTSPFGKLSILRLLIDRDNLEDEPENKYMTVEDVQKYFLPAGLGGTNICQLVHELLLYGLLEPYDPSSLQVDEEQRVRAGFVAAVLEGQSQEVVRTEPVEGRRLDPDPGGQGGGDNLARDVDEGRLHQVRQLGCGAEDLGGGADATLREGGGQGSRQGSGVGPGASELLALDEIGGADREGDDRDSGDEEHAAGDSAHQAAPQAFAGAHDVRVAQCTPRDGRACPYSHRTAEGRP